MMRHRRFSVTALCAMLLVVHGISLVAPPTSLAHPLGNFSISRYAGLRLAQNGIELRYLLDCLLYTSPSPRDRQKSRMPSSA